MTETTVGTLAGASDGAETPLPAPGTFVIDPIHTSVGFVARHLMVARVRGQFTEFTGSLAIAENAELCSVEATIQTASVTTHNDQRDTHLRSADFLDADRYPSMTFRSTGIAHTATWGLTVLGDLTIRECTRQVRLDVELNGVATDPWGQQRIALTATTQIDREDFGITFNAPLEGGGYLIGKTVRIEIEIEAVRQAS